MKAPRGFHLSASFLAVALGTMTLLGSGNALVAGQSEDLLLVPEGSVWSYLDDGSDPGPTWKDADFDDSSWASGPAELGYGDGDEATVVSSGSIPNTHAITTYFRHTFTLEGEPSTVVWVLLRIKRDDAAIVYINGFEAYRTNIREDVFNDPIDNTTSTLSDSPSREMVRLAFVVSGKRT